MKYFKHQEQLPASDNLSRERVMTTRGEEVPAGITEGCSVAGCVRSCLAHCAKCRREICGHHSECCECCAETFCPTCYIEHARGSSARLRTA